MLDASVIRLLLGLLLIGVGVAVWGVLIEPRLLQRRRIEVRLPNLPSAWDGQRLVLIADLQIGAPMNNTDTVRRAVDAAIAERPAAVLLLGDYVYDAARQPVTVLSELLELLRPFGSAGLPCVGVLGNHDFGEGADDRRLAGEVQTALEERGVRILRNEVMAVPAPTASEPLYLVGLGEHAVHEDDWRAAFAQVPEDAARVVLAHDPLALEALPAHWAPLAVAGHTHGGQIRLPTQPELAPARLVNRWPEYVDGWIRGFMQPGNRLFVNRGIGFSRWPIRIGAPPELTIITLRA